MRRFFGYLVIIVSILAISLFDLQPQIAKINGGLEFNGGYEVVYRVDDYDETRNSIDDIAQQVDDKLEASGVKNYTVSAEYDKEIGYNQIRVVMGANNTNSREYALKSVEATGTITVSTLDNSGKECSFKRGSAKVDYAKQTPYVQIEVESTEDWSTLASDAQTAYEKFMADQGQDTSGSEITGIMIVWLDKTETDSYVDAMEDTAEGQKIRDKILCVVPVDYYFSDEGIVKIATIGIGNYTTELNNESAHTLERILNGKEYEYKLTKLYTQRIEPTLGSNIQLVVLISTLSLIVGVGIYLIAKYRLAGLAGFTGLISSIFVELYIFNLMKYTITSLAFLGFLGAGLISLVMILTFLDRYNNEICKGRTPQKANKEAFKQTLPTYIDVVILNLFVSIIASYVSTNEIRMMNSVMIIAGFVAILVTLFIPKWSMYWLSGSKIGMNKSVTSGVNQKDIPDVSKNESQRKFGPFANKDFKKFGKGASIAGLATSLVSIVIVLVLFLIPSVKTFNYSADFTSCGKINITTQETDILDDETKIRDLFKDAGVDIDILDIQIGIGTDVVVEDEENTIDRVDYICITTKEPITDVNTQEAITVALHTDKFDENADIAFMTSVPNDPTYKVANNIAVIALFAGLSVVFVAIRYKYTYGIATLVTVLPTASIYVGLLACTRIPTNALALTGVLLGVITTVMVEIPVFNKMKRLKRESKVKVTTYEQKEQIIIAAAKEQGHLPVIIGIIVAIVGLVFTIIFPNSLRVAYVGLVITTLIGILANRYILVPVLLFSEKHFAIKRMPKNPEKAKRKMQKRAQRERSISAEPEEAIIPGIND